MKMILKVRDGKINVPVEVYRPTDLVECVKEIVETLGWRTMCVSIIGVHMMFFKYAEDGTFIPRIVKDDEEMVNIIPTIYTIRAGKVRAISLVYSEDEDIPFATEAEKVLSFNGLI